jgi:Raf kinase inhibitor-like YbhB/YbcL family protein
VQPIKERLLGLNIQDLKISSPAFADGDRLDDTHAHDRDNAPPGLKITGVPDGTQELAIICHDPDAPLPFGFTHWTLYGVPVDTTDVGADADEKFKPGPNDFGEQGYGGPQPPDGHGPHRYYFWVYALDTRVSGTPSRKEFLEQYGDNIVEQNRVVGVYER